MDLITIMTKVNTCQSLPGTVFACCLSMIMNSVRFHSQKCPGFDNKSLVPLVLDRNSGMTIRIP